ncbi:MAG: PD-(D/E)XK nuclease family protein [Bacteroidales bacterium]|nr:PD-(D/E)XK nuclease family protein [Bacteroidales bacterium]
MTKEKDSFLYRVAKNILQNNKENMQDVLVILPNRRSIRFFVEELKNQIDSPLLLPDIYSIDDLLSSKIVDIKLSDRLSLLYLLYKSYDKIYTKNNPERIIIRESFSDFYYWGDMILNDFDEIDKNLVDTKILFTNLHDYSKLASSPDDILSIEQKKFLENFFNIDFSQRGQVLENFISIWNSLYEIYEDFNTTLSYKNLAYAGKLYKEFYNRLSSDEISFPYKEIKIIGFSTLNYVERKIFHKIKERYYTTFYWDYDNFYTENTYQEAGIFMRENKDTFPTSKSFLENDFDRISTKKQEFNIINSPYESLSVTYVKQWLKEINPTSLKDVAIILHDETLLPLLLKSLPVDIKKNITMGYPFNQSEIYNDVLTSLLSIKKEDFTKENIHNLFSQLAHKTKQKNKEEDFWYFDVFKTLDEKMQEFAEILQTIDKEDINETIIADVINKDLKRLSIDMVSDALDGIQIMGLLETRALDFKYILMLSCSDDNLPKISSNNGFIPQSFKKAYNMMSVERKSALFAYYFYRLLHTVERIDFIYSETSSDKMREMSRFIRQIKIEMPKDIKVIKEVSLLADHSLSEKLKDYHFSYQSMQFIKDIGDKTISPSNLNSLIDCQLKFYLNDVAYIREDKQDDDYLAIAFGNAFHDAASNLYSEKNPKDISNEQQAIEQAIEKTLTNNYDKLSQEREYKEKEKTINALESIHIDMLKEYLKNLLTLDKAIGVYDIQCEKEFAMDLDLNGKVVSLKGRIDRIDTLKDGTIRLLDYKTGKKSEKKFDSIDDAFYPDKDGARKIHADYLFEILFYCYLLYNKTKQNIQPKLLYLSNMKDSDILIGKEKQVLVYDENINQLFEQRLKELLSSLIEKQEGEVYIRNLSEKNCAFCQYRLLCGMNKKTSKW